MNKKNKKTLEDDSTRKKILLRIENEIYEAVVKKAKKENKSITREINELLASSILTNNSNK